METALNVYRVSDGSLVRTIWTATGRERNDCTSMLDFSPDGRKLQCYGQVHDIESGAVETISDADGTFRYPVYAGFAAFDAVAPDGTRVGISDLKSDIELYDSDRGRGSHRQHRVLVLARAYREIVANGFTRRQFSAGCRSLRSGTESLASFQRGFVANRRYVQAVWSQDSAQVGLISADLHLDVFDR